MHPMLCCQSIALNVNHIWLIISIAVCQFSFIIANTSRILLVNILNLSFLFVFLIIGHCIHTWKQMSNYFESVFIWLKKKILLKRDSSGSHVSWDYLCSAIWSFCLHAHTHNSHLACNLIWWCHCQIMIMGQHTLWVDVGLMLIIFFCSFFFLDLFLFLQLQKKQHAMPTLTAKKPSSNSQCLYLCISLCLEFCCWQLLRLLTLTVLLPPRFLSEQKNRNRNRGTILATTGIYWKSPDIQRCLYASF